MTSTYVSDLNRRKRGVPRLKAPRRMTAAVSLTKHVPVAAGQEVKIGSYPVVHQGSPTRNLDVLILLPPAAVIFR